jgi:hypothetical protein
VKGKLDVAGQSPAGTEPLAGTQSSASAAAKAAPQSRRVAAAEKRTAETQKALTKAQETATAAEARVKTLEEELEVAKQLRSELGRKSKAARDLHAETETNLSAARKELKASQKALKKTTHEAQEVALAHDAIRSLEREIVDIDRQMAELTREPDPTQLSSTKGQRPPTASVKNREYSRLEKLRAKKVNDLAERTKDLTRSLAEHVASMTPGAEGRPGALSNAEVLGEVHPALKPIDGRPIDVTTGKPMLTDDWASDHIMSRKEIASDPRFVLLDPAGREEMLLGIKENYLPMTTEANSSKGSMTMNEWLAKRSVKEPIHPDIANALRAVDQKARAAVEAKFEELLGNKP